MSLTADLALVTACRDALTDWYPTTSHHRLAAVAHAALSLIEDTLKRHALTDDPVQCLYCDPGGDQDAEPCPDYRDALAALHAIATALGIETKGTAT